ncbi:MAG: hypothetical protein WCK98_07215 [bacterium]
MAILFYAVLLIGLVLIFYGFFNKKLVSKLKNRLIISGIITFILPIIAGVLILIFTLVTGVYLLSTSEDTRNSFVEDLFKRNNSNDYKIAKNSTLKTCKNGAKINSVSYNYDEDYSAG